MNLHYGIKQPLRIYESPLHRNKYKVGGEVKHFNLLCPVSMLLPFQIKRPSSVYPIASIKLMDDATDAEVMEILPNLDSDDLEIFVFDEYDYLVHYGQLEHTASIAAGDYYLKISDVANTWYSETIAFRGFDAETLGGCALTKLTYYDVCDIGDIFYRTGEISGKTYKNFLYLDIDIGRPAYPISEEGDEDPFGNVQIEYAKVAKQYNLQGVFPEYLLDALVTLPLHLVAKTGVIEILTKRGYAQRITKITIPDPKWQGDDDAIALTDIIFETDQIVKTACCDNLETPTTACLKGAFEVLALQVEGTGNYDNFEYTDSLTSEQVALVHGDRVLVKATGGLISYRSYKGTGIGSPAYVPTSVFANGDGVIDLNRLKAESGTIYYYFKTGANRFYSTPVITSITTPVVISGPNDKVIKGNAWKNCLIEIWENIGGTAVKVGVGTGAQFIGAGIAYSHDPDAAITYIKAIGLNCVLGQSPNKYWAEGEPSDTAGGIGIMEVGSTFIVGGGIIAEEYDEGF